VKIGEKFFDISIADPSQYVYIEGVNLQLLKEHVKRDIKKKVKMIQKYEERDNILN